MENFSKTNCYPIRIFLNNSFVYISIIKMTTVDQVLKTPFLESSHEDKLRIISDGRPKPSFRTSNNTDDKFEENNLNSTIYDKIEWAAGCDKRQKIFCWPCLLFVSSSKWNSGINDIFEHYEQHEREAEHLEAVFKFQLFKLENAIVSPNFEAKQFPKTIYNPYSLKLLIDAICYVTKNATSNNEKYGCNRIKVGDCMEYLNELKSQAYDAIELLEKCPGIVDGLVDAITTVLNTALKEEIKKATYVSIILSEHIISNKMSQISTVLRYAFEGNVYERFVGFTSSAKFKLNYESVANHLLNVIKMYDIRNKFLALSIDGGVLTAAQLTCLFELDEFKDKYFVLCYFNGFGRVLMQSVSHHEDCAIFLKTLSAMESYFDDEDNFQKLEKVLFNRIPYLKKNKWYSTIPFVVFLSTYRKHISFYFENELTCSKFVNPDDVVKMTTFKASLENLKFLFFLNIFSKLFLNNFDQNLNLNTGMLGTYFDRERFSSFRCNVEKFLCFPKSFPELWVGTNMAIIPENVPQSIKEAAVNNPAKAIYADLHKNIMNQLMAEIGFRWKDALKLQFCDFLNKIQVTKLPFANVFVSQLSQIKGFDKDTLDSEITLLKGNKTLLTECKSVYDFTLLFNNYNFKYVFPQLTLLTEFILSIPLLPPSNYFDYKTTKLKQIDNYFYVPQETNITSGESSVLCVEKQLLEDVQRSETFHDYVIGAFYKMKE